MHLPVLPYTWPPLIGISSVARSRFLLSNCCPYPLLHNPHPPDGPLTTLYEGDFTSFLDPNHGGATTTGPDATYPPAICQNSGGGGGGGGGGGQSWGGVRPGVGGGGPAGSRGGVRLGVGGGGPTRGLGGVLPGVGGGLAGG